MIHNPFLSIFTLSISMLKFNICPNKTLIYLKCSTSPQASPFSRHSCTNTSDSTSFHVSYLIDNLNFSQKSASKLCSTYRLGLRTTQKPDSVLNFLANFGFFNSQLRNMISKAPWLLSCNLSKRVLPKFEFFLSKGASDSDIVSLFSRKPRLLSPSLENRIVPSYELVYRFLQSDKDTLACVFYYPSLFENSRAPQNIKLLIDNGVSDSNIARLLRIRDRTLQACDMVSLLKELKDLGFNPSKTTFGMAMTAKTLVTETRWKEKVDAFKKWGWSDEDVIEAFKKRPNCMLSSIDKINLVMDFWVNQMSWDALAIAKQPSILSLSLEKRITPRASVVQFLLNNGLRRMNTSLTSPFLAPEEVFLNRFIKGFKESSCVLKLYEEKLKLACTRNKTCLS